jgi:hypothetical protein
MEEKPKKVRRTRTKKVETPKEMPIKKVYPSGGICKVKALAGSKHLETDKVYEMESEKAKILIDKGWVELC